MKSRPLAIAAIALLALGACSKKDGADSSATQHATVAAVPPIAGKSWTDIVSATPEGGMRMGNPDAPVKIVEYASFTCPHCKRFEDEASDALPRKYVATGKVSYEFRSFLIHGPDAPITLLMNCRGAEPFFALSKQLYAAQDAWMAKLIAMPAAEQQALQNLPPQQQFQKMLDVMGLYSFFAARGLPRAQADKCLIDQTALDKLTADQDRASTKENVSSTPSFFVNGALQSEISTWPQLDAKLATMVG